MESVTGNHTAASSNNDATAAERADYFDSIPIGYRFAPTDEELVTHYLLNKIKNLQLPRNRFSEANVYESHPKDLAANYPEATEGVWYFFSPREWKNIVGKRPRRDAGPGYWRASGGTLDKVIKLDNEDKLTAGVKKGFAYFEGRSPNATKTAWMMHEYVVKDYETQRLDANDMKLDDYVLCKIYKTVRTKVTEYEQPPVDQNQNEQADQNMNAVTQNQSTNPTTNPNDLTVDQASNFFQFF